MPRLCVNLFGGFEATLDGENLAGLYDQARALLVFLMCESQRSHRREFLAEFLWPEETAHKSKHNLRQALTQLRSALGDRDNDVPFLRIDRLTVQFNRRSDYYLDADSLPAERHAEDGLFLGVGVVELEEAELAYAGDFLEGLHLPDNLAFSDWQEQQRENYRNRILLCLGALSTYYASVGDLAKAIQICRRRLELDPWQEPVYRQLMNHYAQSGQRGQALRLYETCVRRLDDEFGIAPEYATQELARRIQDDQNDADLTGPRDGVFAIGAERRQVTVLCCTLAADAELDPEELLEWSEAVQRDCRRMADGFGAYLQKTGNDVFRLFFGYPRAHGDDAIRAAHAGLQLLEGWRDNAAMRPPSLILRLAMHTGDLVVTDDAKHGARTLVGNGVSESLRLSTQAPPGSLIASHDSRQLVARHFVLKPVQLSGNRDDGEAYAHRILRRAKPRTSFTRAAHAASPFLGRQDELSRLRGYWERAGEGRGVAVLIEGQAGIGKTRLAQAFSASVADEASVLDSQCQPSYRAMSMPPILQLMHRIFDLRQRDSLETRASKVRTSMHRLGLGGAERAELILAYLGLRGSGQPAPSGTSQATVQQQLVRIIVDLVLAMGRIKPVLLLIDDLHWIDAASLVLCEELCASVPQSSVLLLLCRRNREGPSLSWAATLQRLRLGGLPDEYGRVLAGKIARRQPLPPSIIDGIVERADGVPLFLEELTKVSLQGGTDDSPIAGGHPTEAAAHRLPKTLQESLTARLDRLGPVKATLQMAAVIGREFDYDHLALLAGLPEQALRQHVHSLLHDGFLFQIGDEWEGRLGFRHTLIWEAAYQSLLRKQRRQRHRDLARALVDKIEQGDGVDLALVAGQFEAAEDWTDAVKYWEAAGLHARQQRLAPLQAVDYLQRAMQLLGKLSEGRERDAIELRLQLAIGVPLMLVQGPVAAIQQAYDRALALCGKLPSGRESFAAVRGLYTYFVGKGDHATAAKLAAQLLELAESGDDAICKVESLRAAGTVALLQGDLVEAGAHLKTCVERYRPGMHDSAAEAYGMDPRIAAESLHAVLDWVLGDTEAARKRMGNTLTLAQTDGHALSLGWALNNAVSLYLLCRDGSRLESAAARLEDLAGRHRIPVWHQWGRLVRHFLRADRRRGHSVSIHDMFAEYTGVVTALGKPLAYCLWGAYCQQVDAVEKGLRVLDGAIAWCRTTGGTLFLSELLRLKAELLVQRDGDTADKADVLTHLDQAMALCRQQGALGFEQRLAETLAKFTACGLLTQSDVDAMQRRYPGMRPVRKNADTSVRNRTVR